MPPPQRPAQKIAERQYIFIVEGGCREADNPAAREAAAVNEYLHYSHNELKAE